MISIIILSIKSKKETSYHIQNVAIFIVIRLQSSYYLIRFISDNDLISNFTFSFILFFYQFFLICLEFVSSSN